MERDLRETTLYGEVEEHFRKTMEPGFGKVTDASDPRSSPDGRWIAFTGSLWEKLEGGSKSRVCLAAADGSGFRELTSGPEHDGGARWSPDGTRLSFASDRKVTGRMQLYVLDAEGLGEAQPLPEIEGTVEDHAWSPDGSRIWIIAAGMHADAAGADGSGANEAERDLPPWIPKVESWEDDQIWRRLWLLDVGTNEVRRLSRDGLNVWEAAWCGPGSVAAIASDAPGESSWYDAPLRIIDAGTGEDRVLLVSDVQLGVPCATADGSRVAVIEAPCSDRQLVSGRVQLVGPSDGSSHPVELPGGDVTWIDWRGANTLAFAGLRGTTTVLGDIDASTGTVTERWSTGEAVGAWAPTMSALGADGFALVRQGFDRPPEVAVVRGTEDRTVAAFRHAGHDHARSLVGRTERVSWASFDGTEIEGFLLAPSGDGPFPLILWVHGGPVWSYQERFPGATVALMVGRGYAILMPNPRGSTGRGRAFIEAVIGDMGGADARDDLAGVDAMIERGIADPDRIGVTGGSYGGFMSCWLPTQDQRFKAAVAVAPVSDFISQHWNSNIGAWDAWFLGGSPEGGAPQYRERSPVFFADRVDTPTLLTAGTEDRCTPPGQAIEFHRALRERGVPTEVVVYPGEGHGVRKFPAAIDLEARSLGWFERFMPAAR